MNRCCAPIITQSATRRRSTPFIVGIDLKIRLKPQSLLLFSMVFATVWCQSGTLPSPMNSRCRGEQNPVGQTSFCRRLRLTRVTRKSSIFSLFGRSKAVVTQDSHVCSSARLGSSRSSHLHELVITI